MFSEWIRRSTFWMQDFLRGSKVRKNFNDLKYLSTHSKETQDKRGMYLTQLLVHASRTTLFYKQIVNFKSIKDFPVINKIIMKVFYSDFQSESI